jgi:hypothetical protein
MSMAAFLSGFLEERADQITRRKAEGKSYFEEQAERARRIATTQLEARRENRRKVQQTASTLMRTANMPEHIVRGLIAAGPEALDSAFQLYSQVPTHEWAADDWENIYASSQFYAQEYNEPLADFIGRTVGLIGDNYRATKETGGDLQSAFAASALGYNAKDKARSDLEALEVAPGFSAKDLLDMESRPGWQSDNESTYSGPNMSVFAGIAPQEELSTADQLKGWETFNKMKEQVAESLIGTTVDYGDGPVEFDPFSAEGKAYAERQAFSQFVNIVGPKAAAKYNFVQSIMANAQGASEKPVGGDTSAPGMKGAEAPETPPVRPSGSVPVPMENTATHDGGLGPYSIPQMAPKQAPEGEQGPNAFQRGWSAIKDLFTSGGVSDRGVKGQEGFSATGVDTSSVRDRISAGASALGRAATGKGGMSDKPSMILQGLDPSDNTWIYKDAVTGEQVKVPAGAGR